MEISAFVAVNIDFPKIVTPPVIINQRKTTHPVIVT